MQSYLFIINYIFWSVLNVIGFSDMMCTCSIKILLLKQFYTSVFGLFLLPTFLLGHSWRQMCGWLTQACERCWRRDLKFQTAFFNKKWPLNRVCAHTTQPDFCIIQQPAGMHRDKGGKECCENQEWWWRKGGKHLAHLAAQLWQSVSWRACGVDVCSVPVWVRTFVKCRNFIRWALW